VIGIHIFDAGAKVKLSRALGMAKNPRAVMLGAAREGGNRLKKHFREKDRSEANKLGGRRTHYWNRVAQSVSAPVAVRPETVVINITDPTFAQKLFGGVIRAKRVKNLAIPQEKDAYGRGPAVFEKETGLKLIFIKSGDHALLATRRSLSQFLQIEYLLTPSVKQDKDPTALPAEPEFTNAVIDRAQTIAQRQLEGGSHE
jgi:hypothetical protein